MLTRLIEVCFLAREDDKKLIAPIGTKLVKEIKPYYFIRKRKTYEDQGVKLT